MANKTIIVRRLAAADVSNFAAMLLLFADLFKMEGFELPGEAYLQKLLISESFIVFVVLRDEDVIGGITAYVLPSYYSASAEVYIYDLAVKTSCQRQGIGRKLIDAVTIYCHDNNYHALFVEADEADTHAIEFYRSTGGAPQNVVHFNYLVK